MKGLAYHPAARAEVEAEVSLCEAERRGAGSHVRADIAYTFTLVREFPQIGRRDFGGAQRIVTRGYRFVIHYQLIEGQIVVWPVAHPSREPGYWQLRRSL